MMVIVSVRNEALMAMLSGAPNRLRDAMARTMTRLSIELQANVKKDKLSGQVLHTRTGTLRRSINRSISQSGDGVVATVGTNVKYAGVHEYGFDGVVTVKDHLRACKNGGTAEVKSHTRHMKLPERSFLRSALREMVPQIKEDIRSAALKALS